MCPVFAAGRQRRLFKEKECHLRDSGQFTCISGVYYGIAELAAGKKRCIHNYIAKLLVGYRRRLALEFC
jgi:hypothetical protein